ncbi:bath-38 [Symbiodinium sp. CCMP2456]|nr:bath-38 [Symbiodinium sp. CCMP2456]
METGLTDEELADLLGSDSGSDDEPVRKKKKEEPERKTEEAGEEPEPKKQRKMEHMNDIVLKFREGTKPACSALLRWASPVFDGMFSSGMKEATEQVIEVKVATKEEFEIFYGLIMPGARCFTQVTPDNVHALLCISDYYQVDFVKDACEEQLLRMPVTVERLLQAHKHDLPKQYRRCIASLSLISQPQDLNALPPDVLLELTKEMQERLKKLRGKAQNLSHVVKLAEKLPTGTGTGRGLTIYQADISTIWSLRNDVQHLRDVVNMLK